MKTSTVLAWGVLAVIVVALLLYALGKSYPAAYSAIFSASSTPSASSTTSATGLGSGPGASKGGPVTFYCQQGQVSATFSAGAVQLDLSDGRFFTLPQVESGSGIRYEATVNGKDELFQSQGSWAALSENGAATYSNCVAAHITNAGNGSHAYLDQAGTFSFVYPDSFSIVGTEPGLSQNWMVSAAAMGSLLAEVQLPSTAQPKTNFAGADFTVGTSADPAAVAQCLKATNGETVAGTATINGITFDKFTSSNPGAGNLYNTTSYRLIRDGQCYALEYTIHSTQLANYPKSAGIKAFNLASVTSQLTGIVSSFKFVQ